MKRMLAIVAALLVAGASVVTVAAQSAATEKALLGAWAGTWTGGSSGQVSFTFVRGQDGKLGGSANPRPAEGEPYTTQFTSVVVADKKVTMKMLTPDGGATITVEATVAGTEMKGTYMVASTDGTEIERGTIAAKKKA